MQALEALLEVKNDLLWIKENGLIEHGRFDMDIYVRNNCNTVCCIAGWHIARVGESPKSINIDSIKNWVVDAGDYTHEVRDAVYQGGGMWCNTRDKFWEVLFGGHNGSGQEAWDRQFKRVNWFIDRERRRLFWERQRDVPKRVRKDHCFVVEIAA